MLHRVIGCIEGVLSYAFLPLCISAKVVLRSLNVQGYCPPEDVQRYNDFKSTVDKGVVIFNHPTFFDHLVIMKELDDTPRFVVLRKYVSGPFAWIGRKIKAIPIFKPSKGASKVITEEIQMRKAGDPLVILSPTAGKASHTRHWFLYPFKSGAFISKPKVLPIIIYYHPYQPRGDMDIQEEFVARLNGEEVKYVMRVLPHIDPIENESAEEYAERCRKIMMKELLITAQDYDNSYRQHCEKPTYGSIDCLLTSHLFMLCGVAAIYNSLVLYGIGMITVFLTSWLYHGTGDQLWRYVDITSNVLMMIVFGFMLLRARQKKPLILLAIAIISYTLKLPHSLFVHIPIALGFRSIH